MCVCVCVCVWGERGEGAVHDYYSISNPKCLPPSIARGNEYKGWGGGGGGGGLDKTDAGGRRIDEDELMLNVLRCHLTY